MKWYQHQSNSRHDTRLRALIQKHGVAGYGLFHLTNEIISEKIEQNPKCILEHTLEMLALEINTPQDQLKAILDDCIKFGLMTEKDGQYQNVKVALYCDNWTKRNLKLQSNYRATTETLQRHSVQNRIDKNRQDEIKTETPKKKVLTTKAVFNPQKFFKDKKESNKKADESALDSLGLGNPLPRIKYPTPLSLQQGFYRGMNKEQIERLKKQ